MNKFNYILAGIMGMALLTGCQDEPKVTINPAAEQEGGLTFILNEPALSNETYVLRPEDDTNVMETLTVREQPNYGFTAAPTYHAQLSFEEQFAEGTFVELGSAGTAQKVGLVTLEVNDAIKALYELKGEQLAPNPEAVQIYVRLRAHLSDATATATGTTPTIKDAYSNAIVLNVQPYYLLLSGKPMPWYIIGSMTPNGGWNTTDQTTVIPFSFSKDEFYTAEGNGVFTYTGWFSAADQYKFIGSTGSTAWNNQVGMKDGELTFEGDNISVPADGYYTYTLNTDKKTCTVAAYEEAVKEPLANVAIVGDFEGWGTTPVYMQPMLPTNNHVWSGRIVLENKAELKLRANDGWDINWGGTFPEEGCGVIGEAGGANFIVPAGEYIITLNDLDNCIYFFAIK